MALITSWSFVKNVRTLSRSQQHVYQELTCLSAGPPLKIKSAIQLESLVGLLLTVPSRSLSGQPAPAAKVRNADALPFESIPEEPYWKLLMNRTMNPGLNNYHTFHKTMFAKYGGIWKLKIPGVRYMVFIYDPEDFKDLLAADGKMPIEPGFDFFHLYRKRYKSHLFPETKGLLASHGEEWYKTRTAVQQVMMRPKSAMFYIKDISDISLELGELIKTNLDKDSTIPDITPLMYRWALEATGTVFLDTKIGCLSHNLSKQSDAYKMIKLTNILMGDSLSKIMNRLPLFKIMPTVSYRQFDRAFTEIYGICQKIISQAIQRMEENKKTNPHGLADKTWDELSVIQKLIDKCGPESSIPLVMALDALMAGMDTTGNTLAFMLYHLATHPDKQEKLYQEIRRVVDGKAITPAMLNELKYLRACQQESQRIYPVAAIIARRTQRPVVLGGYQIPPQVRVSAAAVFNYHSAEQYERPAEFLPERWLRSEGDRHSAHPFAFIPFGHGPRMCIGRRFAELELQVATVRLLERFRLEYDTDRWPAMEMVTPFTSKPDGPLRVRFVER